MTFTKLKDIKGITNKKLRLYFGEEQFKKYNRKQLEEMVLRRIRKAGTKKERKQLFDFFGIKDKQY